MNIAKFRGGKCTIPSKIVDIVDRIFEEHQLSMANVKSFWPDAICEKQKGPGKYFPEYRVTIRKGRYAYGSTIEKAWANAFDAIVQDDELCRGHRGTK